MATVDPYPIEITPSVADVAALIRARTKDVNGVDVGTFNDDTRAISAQVITVIDEAVSDIEGGSGRAGGPTRHAEGEARKV